MGISIIHLTDIHLKSKGNSIENKIEALKCACCSPLISREPVFIIVSGDIAFSGKKNEYKIALSLFKQISDYIEKQKNTEVYFIIVPGNHDCDFDLSNKAREDLQANIINNKYVDESYIEILTKVQENFRSFCEELNCPIIVDDIVTLREIAVKEDKILFLLVNTAWMSMIEETPGKIIIPKNLLKDVDIQNYKLVVTVMHHPTNWLDPDNAADFREYLKKTTDLLIVGHEHRKEEYIIQGRKWAINERYGKELQNSKDSSDSSFVVYYFDNTFTTLSTFEYKWNDGTSSYERIAESNDFFQRNSIVLEEAILPNENTIKNINDSGIIINHFSAEDVKLSEIFVWPELEEVDLKFENSTTKRVTDDIPRKLMSTNLTFIYGDSLTGKTSLAKMMFLEFIKKEYCCLMMRGEDFNSYHEANLNRTIEKFFCEQYKNEQLEKFRQLPKEKKAIIIDNFSNLKYYDEKRNRILRFICDMFDKVIILSDIEMDSMVLFSSSESGNYGDVKAYRLLYLGNKKRREFIRKWYYLREENEDDPEKENKIDYMIDRVNNFLGNGKRFIPAVPLVLISVLQNSDSFLRSTFTGSQYGFLYESLIYKNLSTISSKYKNSGAINIDINILSNLAFRMLYNSKTLFSKDELCLIVKEFENKMLLDIDADSLLDRMIKAKLIYEVMQGCYKFRYPYIYYFFAGRYIAYNMDKECVKEKVEHMSSRLYNEHYGNIMIFVCHYANNIEIIETILLNAYVTLDNYEIFDFNNNIDIFESAQSLINKIFIPENIEDNNVVEKNKEKKLEIMDEVGIQDGSVIEMDDDICDEISEKEKELAAISSSIKTMEVLGQILQNYPGDIDGNIKMNIINEIHDLGMRVINAIINIFFHYEKDLINYFINRAKEDKRNYSHDKIVLVTRNLLCVFLAGIIRGMINKIGTSMSEEYLLPAIKETFSRENLISKKLILQEIKYNCLRSPDVVESFRLFDELRKINNGFALTILRSIVGNYLKYNTCDPKIRNKICDKFGFRNELMFIEEVKNAIK